jgi:hypothetical protein
MKALGRFWAMFCTAGVMLFLGLDLGTATPKQMIMITGAVCGVVNILWGLLDGQ